MVYRGNKNQSTKAKDKAPVREQVKSIYASECYLSCEEGNRVLWDRKFCYHTTSKYTCPPSVKYRQLS